MISASIIIATADRPEMVLDCVRSFKAQVPADVELVVVDAGTDRPVDENALRAEWESSRVIRSPVRNASAQRNMGVEASAGAVVVFLDDDVLVQPGWWPGIVAPLEGNETTDERRCTQIGAVAGAVWVNPAPEFMDEPGGYVDLLGEPVQVTHRSDKAPREVDWALTTNMAIRKDVFEGVGGIAEVYGIYDEDVDLGLKIIRAGRRMIFQPGAAVYHYYLKRPPKPVTLCSEFLLGRNRSMMLVRNFGLLSRVWLFLLTVPWVRLYGEMRYSKRRAIVRLPHIAAYMLGTWKGIADGLRYPVWKDREEGNHR